MLFGTLSAVRHMSRSRLLLDFGFYSFSRVFGLLNSFLGFFRRFGFSPVFLNFSTKKIRAKFLFERKTAFFCFHERDVFSSARGTFFFRERHSFAFVTDVDLLSQEARSCLSWKQNRASSESKEERKQFFF